MNTQVMIHTASEQDKLRESGRIVSLVHRELKKIIKPGLTTLELERVAKDIIAREGGVPSFLGYKGYPHVICSSVDEQIVHGFPNERKLEEGDLLSIDVGVLKNGYHGDAAFTTVVGEYILKEDKLLVDTTYECLKAAVSIIKAGVTTGMIGSIIERTAQARGNYAVVRNYVGHGVGRSLHEKPSIFNFGRDAGGIRLKQGVCICVEPMVVLEDASNYRLEDGWTVVTANNNKAAHVEQQIIVHKDHAEIIAG